MTWLGVDLLRLPCITRRNLRQRVDTRGLERAWPAYSRGRGLICVTGHIGVFELIAHAASLWGYQVTEVARPLAMAPVDEAVRALRSAGGVEVLAKWNVLWHLRRALGRGRVVGLTADETVRRNAVFVPFLGTLAATNPSPALLHLASGAPLCVVTCHRVRRERYRIEVWDLFEHAPSGDRQADVEAIMTRINAALGRAILARPAQWFWGMRRYEHRPPGEQPGPDGLPPPA
ncbi:MAG: hypothetical protein KatS3mg102_2403 [Planctomycetota bacterium]|nr:MAG: hypothetical protein KatS3mg102_2403 [Planctomycetota bacterium]